MALPHLRGKVPRPTLLPLRTVREAATRDEHGQPLCPNCLITDPANHETCLDCGRRRPVSLRTADGPLCGSCVP
jgi:hypothetical protein